MNKIFKRVVATLLTVSAFATIEPAKYINLMTTQAHADEAKKEFKLKEIEVKKSSGSSGLQLYDSKKCKSKDKVDFEEKNTKYYVNIKSGNRVYIDLDIEGSYDYKIKKGSKKYDENEKIPVSSSSTKISVEVWPKNEDSKSKTYTIYVQCDKDRDRDDDDDDDDDDDGDDIYLDVLKVGKEEIDLKKSKTSYSIDVDKSTSAIKIIAEPEEDEYKVTIDGTRVDDDDDYKKTVSLKEGKNEFEIKLKDDDDRRTYKLTINRGKSSNKDSDDKDKESDKETSKPVKAEQWVTVNGNLVYNDSTGNPIKNSWFLDRNSGTWYLFDGYGYARKGWAYTNGTWYYLNPYTGQMQTGWTYVNGTWYYLNQYSGAMQTGWVYDNGVWYYCNSSGAMLSNTTIGGYRLGWNGAWIR